MSTPETVENPVLIEHRGGVAVVTLNRPKARNAIDTALRGALTETLKALGDDRAVRAVVLTGAGPAFSAGGDIKAMRDRLKQPHGEVGATGWLHQRRRTHGLISTLHTMEKPTIAAVNGAAAGLGADLALACDFVMASGSAVFMYSYIARGLIPDGGGLYFLPRRIGLAKAKELIFTGRAVKADEALALGIADRLAAPDALVDAAIAWAGELSAGSPTALGLGKSILDRSFELGFDDISALGSQAQAICYASDYHRSAVQAFLAEVDAKRPKSA